MHCKGRVGRHRVSGFLAAACCNGALNRAGSAMRSILTFAGLALAAGMIVPRYAAHLDNAGPAPRHPIAAQQTANAVEQASRGADSVIVPRDRLGHFRTEGRIDGRRLDFLIDTGASVVVLTADGAASLGLHPGSSEYRVTLKTANGVVRAAPTTLDMVEIGGIMVRDVPAVVMPDGVLSENLLGMSFLTRLRHFEYSDGKMMLEQ
jgi:aspartyl protease family protein